jgi:hypothetical protein
LGYYQQLALTPPSRVTRLRFSDGANGVAGRICFWFFAPFPGDPCQHTATLVLRPTVPSCGRGEPTRYGPPWRNAERPAVRLLISHSWPAGFGVRVASRPSLASNPRANPTHGVVFPLRRAVGRIAATDESHTPSGLRTSLAPTSCCRAMPGILRGGPNRSTGPCPKPLVGHAPRIAQTGVFIRSFWYLPNFALFRLNNQRRCYFAVTFQFSVLFRKEPRLSFFSLFTTSGYDSVEQRGAGRWHQAGRAYYFVRNLSPFRPVCRRSCARGVKACSKRRISCG